MISFSVIIPAYNAAASITGAIHSCLNQSMKPLEIIIVDDCSTDETVIVVEDVQGRYRGECSIILKSTSRNSGPSNARNLGWNSAKGEFIAFLDSDDQWHSQKLERCNTILQEHSDIMVLGHSNEYLPKSINVRRVSKLSILARNFTITPNLIVRSDVQERFDEKMRYTEDHDLILRISEEYPIYTLMCAGIPTSLGRKPMTTGGLSGNRLRMRLGELHMYRKFLTRDLKSFSRLPLVAIIVSAKFGLEALRLLRRVLELGKTCQRKTTRLK